jgi:FKBP-type peptidyl-prolyl cis-trans isomerase 2
MIESKQPVQQQRKGQGGSMRTLRRAKATTVAVGMFLAYLTLFSQHSFAADSPQIVDGSSVTALYHITFPGQAGFGVKDVSQFVQGQHQLLPALEREVTGMKAGEEKKVELSAEEGFGPYDVNKQKTVPKSDLPAGTKEGEILKDHAGQPATVSQLSDSSAVLDYNHPLAGKPLVVQLKILKVENP